MKNLSHLPEKFAFKLDEIGKKWIRETFGTDYYDKHKDGSYFNYPNYSNKKGYMEGSHLLAACDYGYTLIETSQLFPQPQIPTIKKGVMMLVWDEDEEEAIEKEVMFFDGKFYYAKSKVTNNYLAWKNAKPIPPIPEYTLEEAEQKFNIKIKQ